MSQPLPPEDVDAEWDARYAATEQIWSGQPNRALIAAVPAHTPGRALDVGCGEGADAVWLAKEGWQVTALDVSGVALRRASAAAGQAGVHVEWIHSRLEDTAPVSPQFDLVSAQFAALFRTPERVAEHLLAGAVAPGGLLLVVHHAGVDVAQAHARGFNPDDYVSPLDVAAILDHEWEVEVQELPPRDPEAAGHHTHDVVLRARRSYPEP